MTTETLFDLATEWALENSTDDHHRSGHLRVNEKFIAWIGEGCPRRTFSVYMCCRYGKCDVSRNLALLAIAHRQAGQALVIHPSPELAEQFLEDQRMKEWRQRWLPTGPRLRAITSLRDFAQGSLCNDEWLGSIHIHALLEPMPRRLLLEWVEHSHARYRVPPIIFFDEAHRFAIGNTWGRIARDLHAAGCLIVVLTATPFRHDEDDVFGFHTRPKEGPTPTSRQRTYVTAHPTDPRKLLQHRVTRDETPYEIEADVEVPFLQGWSEGHIAKATFDLVDWQMKGWGTYRDERLLSELPQDEARAVLPSLYRDPGVIRAVATRVIRHIAQFRKTVEDATVIWYGMDDTAGKSVVGENQKAIKAALNDLDSSLDVRIATLSTDGEGDEKARTILQKFLDPKTKHFEVLVLKAMGAAGLDSDRICVVVLWNTTRALGQMIQMAMRGGNTRLKNHFMIVALKDVMTTERLEAFVTDEGGVFVDAVETDHQITEVDKTTTPPEGGYLPIAPAEGGMGDSDGRTCSAEDVRLAIYFLSVFPPMIRDYTIPVIAEKAKTLGIIVPKDHAAIDFIDSERACDLYRTNLEWKGHQLGRLMFWRKYQRKPETPAEVAEYGRFYREAAQLIKQRAGILLSWDKRKKDRSGNPEDYQHWTVAADALLEEYR
jgi:hypothetical protein